MSAPAITWFCRNGHLVSDIPHGYTAEKPTKCQYCNSKELWSTLEWGNLDYGKPIVPVKPIKYEHKTIEVDIPVYNVDNLFKRRSNL